MLAEHVRFSFKGGLWAALFFVLSPLRLLHGMNLKTLLSFSLPHTSLRRVNALFITDLPQIYHAFTLFYPFLSYTYP